MKQRIIGIILMIGLLSGMTACGSTQSARSEESEITQESQSVASQEDQSAAVQESQTEADEHAQNVVQESTSSETETAEPESTDSNNVLVVYFSCTNTTKGVAETIAGVTDGDLWEIIPVQAYSADDLDYNNKSSRSTTEQNDSSSRPQIQGTISNLNDYSYIFIGFPIWWYEEPRIIDTFMESYDFTGKTVITFCTSGGSSIGKADSNMKALSKGYGTWVTGDKLDGGASADTIKTWVNGLETGITIK
jgi:flavodoxin